VRDLVLQLIQQQLHLQLPCSLVHCQPVLLLLLLLLLLLQLLVLPLPQ
jgi:hypothetical protein